MKIVNALTIHIKFNLGPPPQEVHVHRIYIVITKTQDEWMPRSLLDQHGQCLEYLQNLNNDELLAQTVSTTVGSWYVIGVSKYNFIMYVHILYLYDLIYYALIIYVVHFSIL